jgi:hypothetical protein
MSIPGSIYRKRTPFQVFRSYYYESDYNDVDRTSGEISSSISLVTEQAVDNFNDFIGLPPTIAYTNSEASVSLEFNDFNGLPYFYLVHTSEPVVSSEAYGNPNIGHALCLGKFGKRISSNTDYYLYRYQAIITENGSPLVVDIPLGPEGPFLAGDNIFFDNPAAHMDIVIANGSNQVIFKDDTGVVQEVAELTVNGDVLIFDPNDKDNQSPLVATENWQFYVGAKGNAVGIVAENFAITGRDSYLLPDFVFAPDYPLNSLAEMELHIKENKHLPHVPSQKDVDKEGFYSIDHMINGQLQNLEELYLHAFQQEEKIKQHQASAKLFGERLRIIQQSLEKLENQNENE